MIVHVGETTDENGESVELTYEAATTDSDIISGLTFDVDCPWGTQQMAYDILDKIKGYSYQPYEATNAILEPISELGDGVVVNGVVGDLANMDIHYQHNILSNISAPESSEEEHEYKIDSASKSERAIDRKLSEIRASLIIGLDNISAEVVHTTGGNIDSFSWELLYDKFVLKSNGTAVFTCDRTGVTVDGIIKCQELVVGNERLTGNVVMSLLKMVNNKNGNWDEGYSWTGAGIDNYSDSYGNKTYSTYSPTRGDLNAFRTQVLDCEILYMGGTRAIGFPMELTMVNLTLKDGTQRVCYIPAFVSATPW